MTPLPLLVAGDPQDAEPEVVVHADDISEHVVAIVVGKPPLRRDTPHVPLPRAGMDFGVVHPIPLTVANIMAEFHVLDALGHGERGGAERPADLAAGAGDHQPRGDVEESLKRDGTPDVCAVLFATRTLDVAADRVQFDSKCLEIRVAQVRVFDYVRYCHQRLTDVPAKVASSSTRARQARGRDWAAAASWSCPFLVT